MRALSRILLGATVMAVAGSSVVSVRCGAATPAAPRSLLSGAVQERQTAERIAAIRRALLPADAWRPFPRLTERGGWEALDPAVRARLVMAGEAAAGRPWTVLDATLLLDFVRSGSRQTLEAPQAERRNRVIDLVLAEGAEGRGRFVDPLVNGVWALLEESYWGYPAHLFMQRAGPGLPDTDEPIVDLGVAEVGALLAWVDYLAGAELDRVSPILRRRLRAEVERRLLGPCLARSDFWWMGWDRQGHPVNNWNPWIVSNWLAAALLLETEAEQRARHVEKARRVLDQFIDGYPDDGGCDEGPSYWSRAAGSLLDALEWMHGASAGRLSIYDHPLVAEMGRYLPRTHLHGEWYLNFADAAARGAPDGPLIYRYGRAIGDADLAAFGAWVWSKAPDRVPLGPRSIGRVLPALFLRNEMAAAPKYAPQPRDVWLPDLQIMVARDRAGTGEGWCVAAKGGHNGESHNHNDVGSLIAYLDGWPLLIDVGVETYTAKTFSPQRYDIWTMQSDWHNVPHPGGVAQSAGAEYRGADVRYRADEARAGFSLEMSGAYPTDNALVSWRRDVLLERGRELRVTDHYVRTTPGGPSSFHFVTTRPVVQPAPGMLILDRFPGAAEGRSAQLLYPEDALRVRVEERSVDDPLLRAAWGGKVRRIVFEERAPARERRLEFVLRPE